MGRSGFQHEGYARQAGAQALTSRRESLDAFPCKRHANQPLVSCYALRRFHRSREGLPSSKSSRSLGDPENEHEVLEALVPKARWGSPAGRAESDVSILWGCGS